ncbi:MAG: 2-hydroxyacyl-CoA dehydratase [Desulfobacterales bacterium]|nr:2-hydroxyacyl-CoA dehydratase [Desulfobacterales bacterium]
MIMNDIQKYKTKPIECWGMMKEMRRSHFMHTWEAQKKGGLVVMGIFEWFLSLCAGFGEFSNPSYGPHFTRMMRDKDEASKCFAVTEAQGFGKSICSSMRCHLGQLYMGLTQKGPKGERVQPDFILQPAACYAMDKTGQIVGDKLGVPHLTVDFPTKDSKHTRRYLVDELETAIEEIGKVTGKAFDDEKFIEAVQNEWECMVLWARISELNKAVPAPLNFRHLWSLRIPNITMRHTRDCVQFYRILYEEVKERVKEGISANGYETCRLLHMFMPPFYAFSIVREPEKYGAVIVGGDGAFSSMAAWVVHEDGRWEPARTPKARGVSPATREDALVSLVDLYLGHLPASRAAIFVKPEETIRMVKDWKAEGVVFMLDRGCLTLSMGQEEQILALKKSGIPTFSYEGSHSDHRHLNEEGVLGQIDTFCEEVLGLSKLQQEEAA